MSHEMIVADHDGIQDMARAKECAEVLMKTYPGHPWIVNAQDDSVWVSLMYAAKFGSYCYYIHPRHTVTPTMLREHVIRGGGELLERLGMPRHGVWDGTIPESMEGADWRHFKGHNA